MTVCLPRRNIIITIFLLQTTIFFLIIQKKNQPNFCDKVECNTEAYEKRLSKALKELAETKLELSKLKQNGNNPTKTSSPPTLSVPTTRPTPAGPYEDDLFGKLVTIIIYRDSKTTQSCLEEKKKKLQQMIPNLTVLLPGNSETSVGSQFNSLIINVKTKYFFFFNARHDIIYPKSDPHSAGWLLNALENIPELDFVSGSVLDKDKLEIPCNRLRLCNWTISQSYEYYRSIGEVMICDEIASSFVGRTASVIKSLNEKNLIFDETLSSMSITDFFLQAKKAGSLSGVLPEVYIQASNDKDCSRKLTQGKREHYESLLPFAHKHKVFRFRDIDKNELDLCDPGSPIRGEDICDEKTAHKVMLGGPHWTKEGTFAYPFIIKNLQRCLFEVTDFLTWKNVSHTVRYGIALGAIKVRGILPWDSGDIDIYTFGMDKSDLYKLLRGYSKFRNYLINEKSDQIHLFCDHPNLAWKVGGIVTIFAEGERKPDIIQMKTDGRWLFYDKEMFEGLRRSYGSNYLEHRMMHSSYHQYTVGAHCKIEGHNACLPDFRLKSGILKEHFCTL